MKNQHSSNLSINKLSFILIAFGHGLSSITELGVQYFIKDTLLIEPANMSKILSIVFIPWILKPFYGILTDLVPIFGYRRKIYILLCAVIQMVCWILISFTCYTVLSLVILLFLINSGLSFGSVLGEAVLVELSNQEKTKKDVLETSKNYISMYYCFRSLGYLTAAYFKGKLLEIIDVRKLFLIAAFIPILVFISGIILQEIKLEKNHFNENSSEMFNVDNKYEELKQNEGSNSNLMRENSRCSLFKTLFDFLAQKKVIIPTFFILIYLATPVYNDPYFYFLVNELNFEAGELGIIAFIGYIITLFFNILYKYCLKNYSFKSVMTVCSLVTILFSSLTYLVVKRIEINFISDFWLCLISNSFIFALGNLIMMPMSALACQLCPKNLEGSVYSFFMSIINFGSLFSILFGSLLTSYLGITSDEFENFPILIIICNLSKLIPLFCLFFIDNLYFHPEEEKSE